MSEERPTLLEALILLDKEKAKCAALEANTDVLLSAGEAVIEKALKQEAELAAVRADLEVATVLNQEQVRQLDELRAHSELLRNAGNKIISAIRSGLSQDELEAMEEFELLQEKGE